MKFGVCFLALIVAQPLAAEVDIANVTACVENARDVGQSPNSCIDRAHAPCLVMSPDAPAAVALCFEEAKERWSTGISDRMNALKNEAPEQIVAMAGIEVKYDLLSGLVQCDRMEEIALLQEQDGENIRTQKSRCTATASGLAFIRLLWRVEAPE